MSTLTTTTVLSILSAESKSKDTKAALTVNMPVGSLNLEPLVQSSDGATSSESKSNSTNSSPRSETTMIPASPILTPSTPLNHLRLLPNLSGVDVNIDPGDSSSPRKMSLDSPSINAKLFEHQLDANFMNTEMRCSISPSTPLFNASPRVASLPASPQRSPEKNSRELAEFKLGSAMRFRSASIDEAKAKAELKALKEKLLFGLTAQLDRKVSSATENPLSLQMDYVRNAISEKHIQLFYMQQNDHRHCYRYLYDNGKTIGIRFIMDDPRMSELKYELGHLQELDGPYQYVIYADNLGYHMIIGTGPHALIGCRANVTVAGNIKFIHGIVCYIDDESGNYNPTGIVYDEQFLKNQVGIVKKILGENMVSEFHHPHGIMQSRMSNSKQ